MGPTDRPVGTHRLVSCCVVFRKNKERRCTSFDLSERNWDVTEPLRVGPVTSAARLWCLDIPSADCRAVCDKLLRYLTTLQKLRRLVGTDANDGIDRRTDRDVTRAVRRRALTAGAGVSTCHSLLGIYGGQSDSGQYLCYPLSVSLHQCSMHIHSSFTYACNLCRWLRYWVRLLKKDMERTCGINSCGLF